MPCWYVYSVGVGVLVMDKHVWVLLLGFTFVWSIVGYPFWSEFHIIQCQWWITQFGVCIMPNKYTELKFMQNNHQLPPISAHYQLVTLLLPNNRVQTDLVRLLLLIAIITGYVYDLIIYTRYIWKVWDLNNPEPLITVDLVLWPSVILIKVINKSNYIMLYYSGQQLKPRCVDTNESGLLEKHMSVKSSLKGAHMKMKNYSFL